jgi:hypothetical protein
MKTKGQQNLDPIQELLALVKSADVVEVAKPAPFARGFLHRIRGFESHRRLQLKAPVEVAPFPGAVIRTA